MPGGRLRSQLLITSRCLGWCGERGSERGSLPLNNLELNWMSHFLNQRTTAGFNSCRLSSQPPRPALPLPRVFVSVARPSATAGCAGPPTTCRPPSKGGDPHTAPKPLRAAGRVCSPSGGVGSPRRRGKGEWGQRGDSLFRDVVFLPFLSVTAFAVTRGGISCNFCLFLNF